MSFTENSSDAAAESPHSFKGPSDSLALGISLSWVSFLGLLSVLHLDLFLSPQ